MPCPAVPCRAVLPVNQAVSQLPHFVPSGLPGPHVEGIALCDARTGWEDGWELLFDRSHGVGPALAAERRAVMRADREECERSFQEVRPVLLVVLQMWHCASGSRLLCGTALSSATTG